MTSAAAALLTQLGMPASFLSCNEFFYEPIATVGTREDVFRLRIADAHLELTDVLFLPSNERAAALPGGGRADGPRTIAIMNAFIGSCFDAILKGEANGFPKAQLDEFPEVAPVTLAPLRAWARSHG